MTTAVAIAAPVSRYLQVTVAQGMSLAYCSRAPLDLWIKNTKYLKHGRADGVILGRLTYGQGNLTKRLHIC